ncbi:N-formylglutamate amidohydrolase [Kiloniella sp. b19]|uniref:N-formylglutamate amidohydrolase n=1 Tax=Kiloniella sp. GXU_MW_B19 TaxID=3141326 RepID=UPI0031DF4181
MSATTGQSYGESQAIADLRASGLPAAFVDCKADKLKEKDSETVGCLNPDGVSPFLLVCEHASFDIPERYNGLGLSEEDRLSHAAWDPGAAEVAARMGRMLNARLVAGKVSRLVYDLNRPPEDGQAMRAQSERIHIPGNVDLDEQGRQERVQTIYNPFCEAVDAAIQTSVRQPILVTIHSFTPVFNGRERAVEIGVLHDEDHRWADQMLDSAGRFTSARVERNDPYGPEDGVTHTLKLHGLKNKLHNVMIEVRNDLIQTAEEQEKMARCLADWLDDVRQKLGL